MPTYEYACTRCGQHVEVFQSFSDDPLTDCGVCGGPLRKVFHPAGVLFRGSGFYVTDSRASAKRPAKTETGPANGEAKTAASSSDGSAKGSASGDGAGKGSTGSTKEKSA